MDENIPAYIGQILLFQHHGAHLLQHILHHIVAVNMQLPLILARIHQGSNLPDHPDYPQDVIRMAVSHKHAMKPPIIRPCQLHLPQNTVAATGIRHKKLPIRKLNQEAGIKYLGYHCIACAQHNQLFHTIHLP